MKNTEWAYFAGLFDGEGSVTISQCVRKTATISTNAGVTVTNQSLRISNNNPIPLLELEAKFGGRVRQHSPDKKTFVWICQGHKAVEFAKRILPYIRIKTGQLEIYISFAALKRRRGVFYPRPLSKNEFTERRELIEELKKVRVAEGGKK